MMHFAVGDEVEIGGDCLYVLEHPALPGSGFAYGQEGRAGIVYQLGSDDGTYYALKVFKPHFRQQSLIGLAQKTKAYAELPGLAAFQRVMLTPQEHSELLQQRPDLLHAALMPWINGQTWNELLQETMALSQEQSLALARALVHVLENLEQESVAHGDLSGANLLIDGLQTGAPQIELVDVEQMYAADLKAPEMLPKSSPGYAHRTADNGIWEAAMDRFSGAVLLAEMLGWCDERIRDATAGESYFAEHEVQEDCDRYRLLSTVLTERWGKLVAELFRLVWTSESLAQCPSFGAWSAALRSVVQPGELRSFSDWLIATQAFEDKSNLQGEAGTYASVVELQTSSVLLNQHPTASTPIVEPDGALEPPSRDRRSWVWLLIPLLVFIGIGLFLVLTSTQDSVGPGFVTPRNGQRIAIGEPIQFTFEPVARADSYLWSFRQRGREVWSSRGSLSSISFSTTPTSDRKLQPGPLEVSVRSIRDGQRSAPTIITVILLEAP